MNVHLSIRLKIIQISPQNLEERMERQAKYFKILILDYLYFS